MYQFEEPEEPEKAEEALKPETPNNTIPEISKEEKKNYWISK